MTKPSRSKEFESLGVVLRRVAARLVAQRNLTLGREGAVNGSGNQADTRPTAVADERPGGVGEERTLNLKKGRTYTRQGRRIAAPGEIKIRSSFGPRRLDRSAGLMLWEH